MVVGTGHYVPQRVRSNEDVARLAGTDNEWITARTGIRERRVAEESENSGTMAYEAAPAEIQREAGMRWPYLARLLPEQLGGQAPHLSSAALFARLPATARNRTRR